MEEENATRQHRPAEENATPRQHGRGGYEGRGGWGSQGGRGGYGRGYYVPGGGYQGRGGWGSHGGRGGYGGGDQNEASRYQGRGEWGSQGVRGGYGRGYHVPGGGYQGRAGRGSQGGRGGYGGGAQNEASRYQGRGEWASQGVRGGYGRGYHVPGGGYQGRGGRGSQGGRGGYGGGAQNEASRYQGRGEWGSQAGRGSRGPSLQGGPSRGRQVMQHESNSIEKLPERPDMGRRVKANHFPINRKDLRIFEYHVAISPILSSIDSKRAATSPSLTSIESERAAIEKLMESFRMKCSVTAHAFNHPNTLYTDREIPAHILKYSTTCVVIEDNVVGGPRRDIKFRVTIKSRESRRDVDEFLLGIRDQAPAALLSFFNTVLRQCPRDTSCNFVGRVVYDFGRRERQSLGEGLEIQHGIFQSICQTRMGLSLNVDVSCTAFIKPLPVIEFVMELLTLQQGNTLLDSDHIKIKEALSGVIVDVMYGPYMHQRVNVSDLTSEPTEKLMSPDDENDTLVDYYLRAHNFVIQHTEWPCLILLNQPQSYIPMEVCKIVNQQKWTKRLNERQILALQNAFPKNPEAREAKMNQELDKEKHLVDNFVTKFGFNIDRKFVTFEARILPEPWLRNHEQVFRPQHGKWNMMDKKLDSGGTVNNWICVNFSCDVSEKKIEEFYKKLTNVCLTLGMTFSSAPLLLRSRGKEEEERFLQNCYKDAMTILQPEEKRLDLLVAILPNKNVSLYRNLKRICETDLGLVSQCILKKNVYNVTNTCLVSLALKVNMKVGGRNTRLSDSLPAIGDEPTIIFGADVTHPDKRENTSPSIAAVVASQDWPEITRYASLVCIQESKKELITDMHHMIKAHIESFISLNNKRPAHIIFYRDGINEDEFDDCGREEVKAIRLACKDLDENYKPQLTFIVVQKRHHTRLFPSSYDQYFEIDKSGNVFPGTVVDFEICHPIREDFYLCSHAGVKGTSRPARYFVLVDDNNFASIDLQKLTYNLCYTFARCTSSVSIVPPVYYAHLAAYRARFYMGPKPAKGSSNLRTLTPIHNNLKGVMFYC